MAFSPSLFRPSSTALQSPLPSSSTKKLFVGLPLNHPNQILLRPPPYPFTLLHTLPSFCTFSTIPSAKQKRESFPYNDALDEDLDEDAFDELFRQLEDDLKNDDLSRNDSDDEISEEDLVRLEQELTEVLGDDELLAPSDSVLGNSEGDKGFEECDETDEEERPVKLKNWQLRRLASALKIGRRKTRIKDLAADVCLDRDVVLELLRDPPTKLLMISAALPDEPTLSIALPEIKAKETAHVQLHTDAVEPEPKTAVPVHVIQRQWSAQKRLKKVQVQTLERVYQRTKRPTNAMICSIVHVTNLPRKRVVKWFEDKRAEDGVPDQHLPFRRSASETVPTL